MSGSSERYDFDAVLAQVQSSTPTPPPVAAFERTLIRCTRARAGRRLVVTIACVSSVMAWILSILLHPIVESVCAQLPQSEVVAMGMFPVGAAVVCAAAVWFPQVGAQMYVRACCWSFLVLGTVGMLGVPGLFPVLFPVASITFGVARLVLGDQGLEPERYAGTFAPAGHRVAMTWALVLASSDALTLIAVTQSHDYRFLLTDACAVGMVVALVGLFRLRAWGVWLNLGLNVLVASLALTGNLDGVFEPATYVLAATALVQLALAVPLARSMLRGRVEEDPRWEHLAGWIGRLVVLSLILISIAVALDPPPHIHGEQPCELSEH
ncbi:MAG: hypothetical protein ACRBN8_01450 [Nannocystales bacterium]